MAKKKSARTRSQQAEEERQQRVRTWMGVFIIAIMVLSSFAFALSFFGGGGGGTSTGALQYRFEGDTLLVNVGGREIPFYSFPEQALAAPPEAVSLMKDAEVLVVAFDPTDEANAFYVEQVRWDFANYIDAPAGGLLLKNSSEYSYPVGGCEQATPLTPVFLLRNGTQSIRVDGSCVVLEGQQADFLLLRDQLLYQYYGVLS